MLRVQRSTELQSFDTVPTEMARQQQAQARHHKIASLEQQGFGGFKNGIARLRPISTAIHGSSSARLALLANTAVPMPS